MVGANKTLVLLFVLAIFLFPSAQAIEADELKAHYAVTLMELAENQDYAIECGPADVLTNQKLLPNIAGYPTSPAVCSMTLPDSNSEAVMFSLDAQEDPSTVITHLTEYYQPDIDNPNHIREENLDLSACDNAQELDNNWWHCEDAVDNDFDVDIYYRLGQPMTYLITYSFTPSFDQTIWGGILDFFRELFDFNPEPALDQDVNAFTRGYFAKATGDGSREVQGFYYAENAQANGRATIIFKDFSFDVREFANTNYQRGDNNRQVLTFDNIAPEDWKKLIGALRLNPNGEGPLPGGPMCGDGNVDFGEECEPGEEGLSCEDLGFSFGEVSCNTNTCKADTSECFNCEDTDGDGYFTSNGLPNELQALSNAIRYATMTGGYEEVDAFLHPLVLSDFDSSEITQAARNYLPDYEACLVSSTEYDCYQEIDLAAHLSTLANGLDTSLSGEACAYEDTCELNAHAFSDQAASYRQLLDEFRATNTEPIFLLDAKELATADFGSAPRNQNYETRLELAFTCAGLATITQNTNFIYHDKGQDQANYDRGYQACRAGMNSVGAKLYYAKEPQAGLIRPGLLDGFATTNPRAFAQNKSITDTNKGYKDLLLQNNAQLITLNSDILESIEAKAFYHVDVEQSQGNLQVIESLEQTYKSRTNEGAATNIIVNTQSDDIIYISQDTPSQEQDFDYSSCEGSLNEVTQEGIITSEEELANLPAGTFQYIIDDWSCFLQDTSATACTDSPQAFDCDDANISINPGEEEICSDGIDNNCNGLIDDSDSSCVDDAGSTGEACNFDTFCDPTVEDISTCPECQNLCPSTTQIMHRQGDYTFSARIDDQGRGEIIVTASGLPNGQGGRICDFDYTTGYSTSTPLERTYPFNPFNGGTITISEVSGTSDDHKITLRPEQGGYRIYYENSGSGTARKCWGADSEHVSPAQPLSNEILNSYDYVSCNYSECESQFDCQGENNYCVQVTDQIRTCQTFNLIDLTCPQEPNPDPLAPNIIYLCP